MIMSIHAGALAGQVIAAARRCARLNQVELGERSGIANSQISKYERSNVIPDVDSLARLLAASGWRLAAVQDTMLNAWDEREAVIVAAQELSTQWSAGAEANLAIAVHGLWVATEAVPDRTGPGPAEELVRARSTMEEQQAEILHLRRVIRSAAEAIAGEVTR